MGNSGPQFMQLYMAVSGLLTFISFVMYGVCAFLILSQGKSSTERTLIGIGTLLHAIVGILTLGVTFLQATGQTLGNGDSIMLVYLVGHLISFAATAMALYGVVRLLNRANQLELLLEDANDDH